MRFLVTPDFNEKLALLNVDDLAAILEITKFVDGTEKDRLYEGAPGIEVRSLGDDILTIRRGEIRAYVSLSTDEDGEHLLLLDISVERSHADIGVNFFATKDPRTNSKVNPNQNTMINPRHNMLVDPKRNITIDPNRNITIDPRRNITIDPNRNITIDPNRNITIDPRRNITIDPNRNITIDPRRNSYYGGPYVYSTELSQEGFVVRANDKVSLIFDISARFVQFIVENKKSGANIFNTSGRWVEFLVDTDADVRLRFDTSGEWLGIIV